MAVSVVVVVVAKIQIQLKRHHVSSVSRNTGAALDLRLVAMPGFEHRLARFEICAMPTRLASDLRSPFL